MQIVVSDFYHANSHSVAKCSAAVSLNWFLISALMLLPWIEKDEFKICP